MQFPSRYKPYIAICKITFLNQSSESIVRSFFAYRSRGSDPGWRYHSRYDTGKTRSWYDKKWGSPRIRPDNFLSVTRHFDGFLEPSGSHAGKWAIFFFCKSIVSRISSKVPFIWIFVFLPKYFLKSDPGENRYPGSGLLTFYRPKWDFSFPLCGVIPKFEFRVCRYNIHFFQSWTIRADEADLSSESRRISGFWTGFHSGILLDSNIFSRIKLENQKNPIWFFCKTGKITKMFVIIGEDSENSIHISDEQLSGITREQSGDPYTGKSYPQFCVNWIIWIPILFRMR